MAIKVLEVVTMALVLLLCRRELGTVVWLAIFRAETTNFSYYTFYYTFTAPPMGNYNRSQFRLNHYILMPVESGISACCLHDRRWLWLHKSMAFNPSPFTRPQSVNHRDYKALKKAQAASLPELLSHTATNISGRLQRI